MKLHVNETEPGSARVHAEAVDILTAVRRRLVSRLSVAVVTNKQQLLGRATLLNSPLTCDPDLAELAAGLGQIDQTIAAITTRSGEALDPTDHQQVRMRASEDRCNRTFTQFASLVAENRLEEASRELSRILQMPHDRSRTATHFFARTTQANPVPSSRLATLHEEIATASAADGMRMLMKTFGFQAVESRTAMEALRSPYGPAGSV